MSCSYPRGVLLQSLQPILSYRKATDIPRLGIDFSIEVTTTRIDNAPEYRIIEYRPSSVRDDNLRHTCQLLLGRDVTRVIDILHHCIQCLNVSASSPNSHIVFILVDATYSRRISVCFRVSKQEHIGEDKTTFNGGISVFNGR